MGRPTGLEPAVVLAGIGRFIPIERDIFIDRFDLSRSTRRFCSNLISNQLRQREM
jgi:hypothetical protein